MRSSNRSIMDCSPRGMREACVAPVTKLMRLFSWRWMESSVDAISVPNRQSAIQINAKGPLRRKTWRRSGKQLCLKRRKSWLMPSLPSGLSAFESKEREEKYC